MNIHEYKSKKLHWYNRLINLFLIILLSGAILSFISLAMMKDTIDFFEDKSSELANATTDIVVGSIEELISGIEIQDEIQSEYLSDLPEGDICQSLDRIIVKEDAIRELIENKCKEGPLDSKTLVDEAMDLRLEEMKEDIREEIETNLNESLNQGSSLIETTQEKIPFFTLINLGLIIIVLLGFYWWNNDLVILINYVAKKMVFIVTLLICLPYIVFKTNLLGLLMQKMDLVNMMNLPVPVNPQAMFSEAIEIVSQQFAAFYSQYLIFALITLILGITLWIVNKVYILPYFDQKLADKIATEAGLEKPKEKAEKEEKKSKSTKKANKK